MGKYIGDLLFGAFVIILLAMFLKDATQANQLVSGVTKAYVGGAQGLASIGGVGPGGAVNLG